MSVACGENDEPTIDDAGLGMDSSMDLDANLDANVNADAEVDAEVDAGADAGDPPCHGPPGLYVDGSCTRLADGVQPYTPSYALWSDGAQKERFLFLPAGTTIDTTDPDAWIFPVGTTFWKTFALGALRIETRVLTKVSAEAGTAAWTMRVYAWNEAQDAVTEVVDGVTNALDTEHDIPAQAMCERCHQGSADVGLGVSAIQLNHDGAGVTLASLEADHLLSADIPLADAVVPGNDVERAALGYMHANCSHCHDGGNLTARFNMRVRVGDATVQDTNTYTTGVSVMSRWAHDGVVNRIEPANPDASAVIVRMGTRGDGQMPPIATEQVDDDGVEAVREFILSLPVM